MQPDADFYIEKFSLLPHPEGGFFAEIYRSDEKIRMDALPERYNGERVFATSIYFLLKGGQRSMFHRLKSDEIWHYYDGSPVHINIIKPDGASEIITLGKGYNLQAVIPRGNWFAAEPVDEKSFVLVGCTVSPGFDFSDFEMGERTGLLTLFPDQKESIIKFTKESPVR